jgi:3,4-dihydroxy 2-butanone 4-phosphate synthase
MDSVVEKALEALTRGRPVLVYDADGREEETDFVAASEFVNPGLIRMMRKDAGGLICATVPALIARKLGLPLLEEALGRLAAAYPVLRGLVEGAPPYDSRSAFSVTVNHRDTYTGVTDKDRALTISALAKVCRDAAEAEDGWARELFMKEFRSPGHVHLLIAAHPLLEARRGHTELATALTVMAGLVPTAALCEMMGEDGNALSKEDAKEYARVRNLVFIEGREILEAWRKWSGLWLQESSISST